MAEADKKSAQVLAGDDAKIFAGDDAQFSAGDDAKVSACDDSRVSETDSTHISAGDDSRVSEADGTHISAGDVIKRFIAYYKPYRTILVIDLICALILAGVDIAFPQLLRFFTNDFFTRGADVIISALGFIAAGLLVLYIIRTAAQFYITRWGHIMGSRMEADMRRDLFSQYQRLSFSYYDKNNSADMMSRIVTDLFDISELAHHGPENILICGLKIIGSFALMFMINVLLTLVMLVITIVMVVYSVWLNYRKHLVFRENRERMSDINQRIQDSLGGIRTVKSFGNEGREISAFSEINNQFLDTKRRSYMFMSTFNAANSMFAGLLYTITIVGGGYLVATGGLAVTELAIFALYIGIFIAPIELLINFTEVFQKGYAGFKRFMEIMALRPDVVEVPNAVDLPKNSSLDIEYKDVHFAYDVDSEKSREHEAIRGLNLRVEEGQSVALVGPSGMGKSTICSLLSRFYDVDSGSVKIGGHDVRELKIQALRNTIGIVSQDIFLFNGTIAQNIAYANPDAPFSDVVIAAKAAHIHDFIVGLDKGYDTRVGERGARLSGGQKQRIAIARLFLRNPRILVLDEATSALDNESEAEVQKSLDALAVGRTSIIIAHRLSTIKSVDKIAVIDKGQVAEFGTHDELLAADGIYKRYYDMQFKS